VNVVRNFGEFVMVELPQASPTGISLDEAAQRIENYVEGRQKAYEARIGRSPCERCVTHLRSEVAAQEIADLAMEVEADLIVVGTHSRRGMSRWVLGSVAEGVVRRAECPVLVVRDKATDMRNAPIEEGCADCIEVRRESGSTSMWCPLHEARNSRISELFAQQAVRPSLRERMSRYFSSR
jgi:nucleotide-binding universal stress UspA family protein